MFFNPAGRRRVLISLRLFVSTPLVIQSMLDTSKIKALNDNHFNAIDDGNWELDVLNIVEHLATTLPDPNLETYQ